MTAYKRLYAESVNSPEKFWGRQAKELLVSRGVPYQEIEVIEPPVVQELTKIAGDAFVPTLVAGRHFVRGFEPADYHNALDQAGFGKAQAQAKP